MPAPGEPAWTEEDRDLALEWQHEQSLIHQPCGQPLDLTGPDHARAWVGEEVTCEACSAIAKRRRGLIQNAQESGDHVDGVVVIPVYRPELLQPAD